MDANLTTEMVLDKVELAKVIANSAPRWEPCANTAGYHALSFGWIVDELVRRIDIDRRSVAEFYNEEIKPLYLGSGFFFVIMPNGT